MTTTVSELAALVSGRVVGNGDLAITGIADVRTAAADRIGFIRDRKYRAAARATAAGALITYEELETDAVQIVVADVAVAFARVALHFHPLPRAEEHSVHPTAVVDPAAELVAPVSLGPGVVVGKARIDAGTVLMPGVTIGDRCRIGRDCVLHPRVVLYDNVELGDRVVIHAGSVIGSDGFGYAREGATFVKVPQMGGVKLADDVEIGANCAIDCGAMGDTRIGARTKIDNLCHIAHNVTIGEDCAFAAAALIAGSTVIGDRVIGAGHAGIGGHLKVSSDVRIGGNSVALRNIREPGDYMGFPLMPKTTFVRLMMTLPTLVNRLVDLEGRTRHLPPRPRVGGEAVDEHGDG